MSAGEDEKISRPLSAISVVQLQVEVRYLKEAIERRDEAQAKEIAELKGDVKMLTAAFNQARGGLWVMLTMGSIAGAIAGWVASMVKLKVGG